MSDLIFIIAGLSALTASIVVIRGQIRTRKRRKAIAAAFSGRIAITPAEFQSQYFADTGIRLQIIEGTLQIIQEVLMLDAARLLPSDDFTGNLRFVWRGIDDWADVEIVEQLEKRFEISVSDSEAANCKTVSDLIYLVAGKLHPHE